MKHKIALLTLAMGLGLTLSLSNNPSLYAQESTNQPPNLTSPSKTLSPEILKNATYQIPSAGTVTLVNGSYQSQTNNPLSVTMAERIAYGDLNGDGTKDAAVLLAVKTGGSGVFKYLALVIPEKGKPVNLSTISLGDRVTIKTLSIRNGKIKIKMLTHSPTDPLCCPTQEIIQGYQLNPQTNQLMVTSLTEQELNPNGVQPQLVPPSPISVGDNVPVQPPTDEIEFRF